ncbi:hypothetical protein X564_18000 [Pseudoalteromonas agarivorans]|nr:hypothetical protein X564_18000 [Pseudoalteromonas agarivorans]
MLFSATFKSFINFFEPFMAILITKAKLLL